MRQIEKRLQKLKEAIRPDDNMFTFEELYRSMWLTNKKDYLKLASRPEYLYLKARIPEFEWEDEKARKARRSGRGT
jgi:hypothetical protein